MDMRAVTTEVRMAHWMQIMQDRKASGESIRQYCENREIGRHAYFYWQKKLRECACNQLAVMQAGSEQAGLIGTGFAEVRLREGKLPVPVSVDSFRGQLSIEGSGVKIIADSAYPAEQLVCLLRELARP
jgi:hypothetical protein